MCSSSRRTTSSDSGNHARTFLHRTPDGRLVQLPVSWYAERGGYWAMSPGYDRPAHLDFRRVIDAGCMSCHNGYPPSLAGAQPSFGAASPPSRSRTIARARDSAIRCPRASIASAATVPGRRTSRRSKRGDIEAGRRAIVNPATLDRERQLETCMQCHLESTSSPLPFQIRRYEHPPFSYTPGQPLGDYFIHFDHAPGTPAATTNSKLRAAHTACASRRVFSAAR